MSEPESEARGDRTAYEGGTARFGSFELDLVTGELRRNGVLVKLQEQPFRILRFLIEHQGELVTREVLREHLWPAEFVDFDHSLNTAVRKLRTALDDSADNPRFVETLARRGYRFIAPVTFTGPGLTAAAVPPAVPVDARVHERRSLRIWIAAAAIVALLVAVAAFVAMRSAATRTPASTTATIAVLPFLSENDAPEHLSDGLSEVLMNALSRVPDLRVMGRSTVFRYKGRPFDILQVGRDLKVGAVVTGTVRAEGNEQTISIELLDATDGARLWGQRYETRGSTLPAVHSRIAEDLTHRIRRGLGRTSARMYSTNPRAYDQYLQGLQAWNRRTPAELHRAETLFRGALAADPDFAAAYAALAQTYGIMVAYELLPADEGTKLVLANARAALRLDPSNAEAYVSLATSKFRQAWDWEGAGADYRRALELNPSSATAHQWYADYLRALGRFSEASAEVSRAWELDPGSFAVSSAYCWDSVINRRFDEALVRAAQIPRRPRGNQCVVNVLLITGRYEALIEEVRAGGRMRPETLALFAKAYRENGARGVLLERIRFLRGMRGTATNPHENTMDVAATYALLDDGDRAFETLERAYAMRATRLTQIHVEPIFDPLRDDPRFDDLMKRVGIPVEAIAAADELRRRHLITPAASQR